MIINILVGDLSISDVPFCFGFMSCEKLEVQILT